MFFIFGILFGYTSVKVPGWDSTFKTRLQAHPCGLESGHPWPSTVLKVLSQPAPQTIEQPAIMPGAPGGANLPKPWSARDGATEPYRDVFTGVFWEVCHSRQPAPKLQARGPFRGLKRIKSFSDNRRPGLLFRGRRNPAPDTAGDFQTPGGPGKPAWHQPNRPEPPTDSADRCW